MYEVFRHAWAAFLWWWTHPARPDWHHVDQAGFIIAIIAVIIQVAITVGKYVLDAAGLVFDGVKAAVKFAARGVVWLTGLLRKGFAGLLDGLKHTFDAIERWVGNLYCLARDTIARVTAFLDPIIKVIQKIRAWYDLIWKRVVQPILNIIQRIRKVLAIFKFFHLKWAEKLDRDLAYLEGQIAKNFLIVRQWLNLVGSWVNFLVNPLGGLRAFPMVAGFFGALNTTWSGLFGSQFTWLKPPTGSAGPTSSVSSTMSADVAELHAGTGDSGDIASRADTLRIEVFSEMGVRK